MMRFLLLFVFLFVNVNVWAEEEFEFNSIEVYAYIDKFKDYAIIEMERSGIPASIKLAQGILESNAGRSELAIEANNHFGMKCGSAWEGPTYYKKDDDRDRSGRLIPSCFRVFNDAYESYIEHSNFLLDPRKSYRYGSLFDIDIHDYKSWAWGLKESGYATNKKYAILLINLIERYELYTYDYYEGSSILYIDPVKRAMSQRQNEKTDIELLEHGSRTSKLEKDRILAEATKEFENQKRLGEINGKTVVYLKPGEKLTQISNTYDVTLKQLKKYNEIKYNEEKLDFDNGDVIYLEKKRSKYKGKIEKHLVRKGESMYDIAQRYGVKYKKLLKRNRIEKGHEPLPGQVIKISGGKIDDDEVPLTSGHIEWSNNSSVETSKEELPVSPENTRYNDVSPYTKKVSSQREQKIQSSIQTELSEKQYHIIEAGDTLYGLSKKYGISLEELKRLNNKLNNTIYIGQKLRVK